MAQLRIPGIHKDAKRPSGQDLRAAGGEERITAEVPTQPRMRSLYVFCIVSSVSLLLLYHRELLLVDLMEGERGLAYHSGLLLIA